MIITDLADEACTDQQTNVSLMFRKLRRKIKATKSTYSDQTRNIEKESSIWSVI